MIPNLRSAIIDPLFIGSSFLPVTSFPLVVDLDETLVKTDLLVESFLTLIKQNPLYIFVCFFWLLKGRAFLKRQISQRVILDVGVLPYNHELLDYLKVQRALGRRLVLATASDERIARQVADYLQLFDKVLASNGTVNLSGEYPNEKEHAVAGAEGQYVQGQLEEVDFLGLARASVGPVAPYLH